jgi:hypothetical protein
MLGAMTKGKRMLGLVGVAAGLIAFVGWRAFAPPPPRINLDSFARIQPGMTQAEVEAILGVPPGDYAAAGSVRPTLGVNPNELPAGARREDWWAEEAAVAVWFGQDGRVVNATAASWTTDSPWLERVRRWLGL